MNVYILIGILGSVASIVSLLIASPNKISRIIHMIYGFLLTIVIGSSFIYNQNIETKLMDATIREKELTQEIERMNSIKQGAKEILNTRNIYTSSGETGTNRGFILTSFAFLEKHHEQFPESYSIAKELLTDGLKITKSAGKTGSDEYYNEQKRMFDGATAMESLLKGIAGGKI